MTRSSRMGADVGLPDIVGPGLVLLLVGINPGVHSARAGAHYGNPRNAFWRCLHHSGITPREFRPQEQALLLGLGVGLTNSVGRVTSGSAALKAADYVGAWERLAGLVEQHRPRWVGFVGKDAYAPLFRPRRKRVEHGIQAELLGGARVFVLPSTSPANAVLTEAQKTRWFSELRRCVWGP